MVDRQPTISFERVIQNFDSDMFEEFQDRYYEAARSDQLPLDGVEFNIKDPGKAYELNVLGGYAVALFHRTYGLPFGPDEVSALADHLDATLPDSVDQFVDVATFPLSEYGGTTSLEFRAGAGTTLLDERKLILASMRDY